MRRGPGALRDPQQQVHASRGYGCQPVLSTGRRHALLLVGRLPGRTLSPAKTRPLPNVETTTTHVPTAPQTRA